MLEIGKIVNTFGIKGELKVLSDSEFVEERFKVGNVIYLEDKTQLEISSFRLHNGTILIRVDGKNDINEVEKYKNHYIFVEHGQLPQLEEGYYLFQLEHLDVYNNDEKIGEVIEVLKPSQTVLRIKLTDHEIMIPFVDAYVNKVDLANNSIHINLIEGL